MLPQPDGHAHPRLPALDIIRICPTASPANGHVHPGPRKRGMSIRGLGNRTCPHSGWVGLPCSRPAAGDKVVVCLTGRTRLPFRPRGSGATTVFCLCGGTGCARRPVPSRRPSTRPGCSPTTGVGPLHSGTTRRTTRPSWWRPRHPGNGRFSALAFSTRRHGVASPGCTPRPMNGIRVNPVSPPPRPKPSRRL